MFVSVPVETQGRIAADIALDLLELYSRPDTQDQTRAMLKVELRRLEPLIAEAARLNASPFRRGSGLPLQKIRSALAEIEFHAEILAEA